MVDPVALARLFAGKRRKIALQEIPEGLAHRVDVPAVAVDEVHRHIERIIGIAIKAEPLLEHKGQHARPMGIGVGPDMAAIGKKAARLRSEEHPYELPILLRNLYAVFCLKNKIY